MGFLEAASLLSLVLEPSSHLLVDQLARVQSEIAVFDHHIGQAVVEVCDLRDFSRCQQLSEVFDLSTDREVIVSQLV